MNASSIASSTFFSQSRYLFGKSFDSNPKSHTNRTLAFLRQAHNFSGFDFEKFHIPSIFNELGYQHLGEKCVIEHQFFLTFPTPLGLKLKQELNLLEGALCIPDRENPVLNFRKIFGNNKFEAVYTIKESPDNGLSFEESRYFSFHIRFLLPLLDNEPLALIPDSMLHYLSLVPVLSSHGIHWRLALDENFVYRKLIYVGDEFEENHASLFDSSPGVLPDFLASKGFYRQVLQDFPSRLSFNPISIPRFRL